MQITPSSESDPIEAAAGPNPEGRPPREGTGASGRILEPFLLFELLRSPSYGYELIRRLDDYGFRRSEPTQSAVVYKVLRALEESGSIRSTWATQESGPARRYYELTDPGRALLDRRLDQLGRHRERIDRLLAEHEELVNRVPVGELETNKVHA